MRGGGTLSFNHYGCEDRLTRSADNGERWSRLGCESESESNGSNGRWNVTTPHYQYYGIERQAVQCSALEREG